MRTRIKKFIKISFPLIFNAGYGYLVFYIFPTLLLFAFNRTKGAVNNPDGELFIPFAWLLMILIPIIFFFVNKAIINKCYSNKKFFAISVVFFIVGATIGVINTNATYSINYTNILNELGFKIK